MTYQLGKTGAEIDTIHLKVDGIEENADVTDATNVDAAGAVMNTDTSTVSMSFVIDEDDMVSNSPNKIPTQQSVKAYVDAQSGGATDLDGLTDVTITTLGTDELLFTQDGITFINQTLAEAGISPVGHTHTSAEITDFDTEVANNSAVTANTAKVSFDSTSSTKLAGIEALADVTDTANVTSAGALMDSEVASLYGIKTLTIPDNTTVSTFGASLIDDLTQSAARTTLGVDAAGTDNSTNVTLAGTPDYITISGQTITRNQIDLTTDVTGVLPVAKYATGIPDGTKFVRDDGTLQSIPGGGDALTSNPLSQFAATTSSQLAGVISDETGSGALVFATSPTLVTPILGTPTSGTLTNCTGLPISGISGATLDITELNYVDGVTSAIQTQLNGKAPTSHTHATSDITSGTFDNARIAESNITQHEAALTITEAQISDLGDYATSTELSQQSEVLMFAVSDEGTALTTGTAKLTFRMPYAMTLTAVRASVTTAPTGATITVDINETGTTILSTKLTIDATEKTSTTAATPAVISDSALADDAEITVDIDQVGSTIAGAGLKITLIGTRA